MHSLNKSKDNAQVVGRMTSPTCAIARIRQLDA